MLIHWPTVIFQIINFLILIALLKRFLYGPILRAMDERERQVAAVLAAAQKAEDDAAHRVAYLAQEQKDFAKSREGKMLKARQEVEAWKNDALQRLQAEIEEKRAALNSVLLSEQQAFLHQLKGLVSNNIFKIAKKALADLADDELEARLITTFVTKIAHKEEGVDALLSTSAAEIDCITGFPLASAQKEQLQKALSPYLSQGRTLSFQVANDLGFGVRLLSDGQKWEWNLNRYMLDLEMEIQKNMNSFSGVPREQ